MGAWEQAASSQPNWKLLLKPKASAIYRPPPPFFSASAVQMSRRAAIVEEFDDDTDLPLPSRSLPNTGSRGAILEQIANSDDGDGDGGDSDEAPELLDPSAVGGPALQPSVRDTRVTDITPYKKCAKKTCPNLKRDRPFCPAHLSFLIIRWTCIYPIYIDAKRPYATGARRISRSKSVWWPLSKDIADACSRMGLGTLHEVNKMHPSDWENPGRVRVQWKKDGRPVNSNIRSSMFVMPCITVNLTYRGPPRTYREAAP
jgi:signal recognition particle subunit SRP19